MTVIATLRPAEKASAGDAYAIASIPLSKLVPWDGNIRKTGAADGLDELTASIAAHGVLAIARRSQDPSRQVRHRRRTQALPRALGARRRRTIAADAPVPCRVIPRSADATEISLTENVVRTAMHPADQFEAFRDAGASVADVAARFSMSGTAVKQRMRLARVSPLVFAAYRGGELTLEQAQAYAVSDDHEAQERVFSDLENGAPHAIRRALTEETIPATDRRARFVTVEAYEGQGRRLRPDRRCGVGLLRGRDFVRTAVQCR